MPGGATPGNITRNIAAALHMGIAIRPTVMAVRPEVILCKIVRRTPGRDRVKEAATVLPPGQWIAEALAAVVLQQEQWIGEAAAGVLPQQEQWIGPRAGARVGQAAGTVLATAAFRALRLEAAAVLLAAAAAVPPEPAVRVVPPASEADAAADAAADVAGKELTWMPSA